MSQEKYVTQYTPDAVCPYCGYLEPDSWEYKHDSADVNCNECGELFYYQREVTTTYCTKRKLIP